MNEIYATYFPLRRPARATIQAARLPRDVRVEIDLIAIVRFAAGREVTHRPTSSPVTASSVPAAARSTAEHALDVLDRLHHLLEVA